MNERKYVIRLEIGEDGGSLSQGQKQLICIARVMLCRPHMLILDEATSSIDTMTEKRYSLRSTDWPREGRRSSSLTVCQRCSGRTRSLWCVRAASWSAARISLWWKSTGFTTNCIRASSNRANRSDRGADAPANERNIKTARSFQRTAPFFPSPAFLTVLCIESVVFYKMATRRPYASPLCPPCVLSVFTSSFCKAA